MNHSKSTPENPKLLTELMILLQRQGHLFGQRRVFNRVVALVMAELFCFGRHTITQLLLSLGLTDTDWSAFYRIFSKDRFNEEKASRQMLKEMSSELPVEQMFVVGVDGFHVSRTSHKMPGTGWMRGMRTAKFRPGIQRGQRFVEGSWLTPMVNGYSRAIPIRCLSAFTVKAVESAQGARTEVQAGLKILQWTPEVMDEQGHENQVLMSLNDGSYDTLDFWRGLPQRTIAVVRTARNRALYELPAADAHGNKRYGEKAIAPYRWLKKRKGFSRTQIQIRGNKRSIRYRLEGPYLRDGLSDIPLFLIVIGGGKRPKGSRGKNYKPGFYLVSAIFKNGEWVLPLPVNELLAWLWQRWELEVAHRQLKSNLGLGEKQCWNDQATVATVQWSIWVYSLMLLSGYRAWGDSGGQKPPGLWRKNPGRWSFNTLWRGFRAEMWGNAHFQASWDWSRNNWLEKEVLWTSMLNSILGSSRA